jgi:hypothetical protein
MSRFVESLWPSSGANADGCASPLGLRSITPKRAFAIVGRRYGLSFGSTLRPCVTPARWTSVSGKPPMLSALSSGARGKRFSCQISGCRNPSAVAGLLAGAPTYPTVYQPGVRAVNFHEMRGGSLATRRTSASSVKCWAGSNVQATPPSGRAREPVARTSVTEPAS